MTFLSEYVAGFSLIVYVLTSLFIFTIIVNDKELQKFVGVEKRTEWVDKCWTLSAWWGVSFLYLLYLRKKMNTNSNCES